MSVVDLSSIRKVVRTLGALSLLFLGFMLIAGPSTALAQALSEGFAVVPVPGWTVQNNSVPVGSTGWFQGNSTVFPAQAGPAMSYIGSNFNATTGTNTISNWLITPQRTLLSAGDVIKFWTRTTTANPFPDRMQVRLSLAGASTNVGSGPTGLGDFTTLLLDVNPTYGGDYPEVWTEYTITLTAAHVPVPASGRIAFRYFVEMGGPTGDNSNYIGIDTFSYTPGGPVVATDAPLDFNGDGRTDYVLVRNVGGGSGGQVRWFYNFSGAPNPTQAKDWGISTDFFVSEDFDGDDKDDIVVYRPSTPGNSLFYVLKSMDFTLITSNLGQTGDNPTIVDDYNGDNKADFAVYRGGQSAGQPSFWYYQTTPNGPITYKQYGLNGDFPCPGDYDGNGSADFCVQRNNGSGLGNFWRQLSTGVNMPVVTFGTSSDLILPGDYDGDGITDICVARGSGGQIIWHWLQSSNSVAVGPISWGLSASDFPTQGDYTGDGRTDIATWRPSATPSGSAFYVRDTQSAAINIFALGQQGDYPVANYNSH